LLRISVADGNGTITLKVRDPCASEGGRDEMLGGAARRGDVEAPETLYNAEGKETDQ